MNSEIVIKITAQGAGQQPLEASLQGESGTLPAPDRNSESSGRLGAASGGNVPSPSDSLGSSSTHGKQAPSPEGSQSQMGSSESGGGLPRPVHPDEIENLGSKKGKGGGAISAGPPVPESE